MGYEAKGQFVAGDWQTSKAAASFDDFNPATGEVWSIVPDAVRDDAKAAIEAAAAAFAEWSALDHATRSKHLLKVA
ncbi:MAG: aldehyde dehydrogenase family protein, partial [Alphaproteobacteria bacterium]|nr:aldehyde dehydrogenase family protein [Alphaproteobacteria bacterium]